MASAIFAGILSAMIQAAATAENNNKQLSYNKEMQDKQNAYNSPVEQMKRLKEAGISPASMSASQGLTIDGNTSASALPLNLQPLPDIFGSASLSALNFAKGKTENDSRELYLEQIRLENDKLIKESEQLGFSNSAQEIINKYVEAREQYAVAESASRTRLNIHQSRYFNQQIKESQFRIADVLPQEIRESISREHLNVYSINEILARIKDYESHVDLNKSQTELNLQSAETQKTQQNLNQSLSDQAVTQAAKNVEERGLTAQISDKYLERLQAEIRQMSAMSGKTEEETYWIVFDKLDKYTPRVYGLPLNQYNSATVQSKALEKARSK